MNQEEVGRSMSRRTILLGILVLCALACAALWWVLAKPTTPSSGPPERIAIATFSKAMGNAPFHVARRFGWFEEHPALRGIEITYAEYNDRPAIASALSRGDLDLLFSAEIPSILIRAQGVDSRIVLVSTYAAQEIVVPTSSTVDSVSDLRGRRIAVQSGTSSHFGLYRILNSAGLRPSDVRIVYMPAAEGQAAFETGQIDAWAAWAPWVETQEVAGRGRALPGGNATIYSVGTMRSAFINRHTTEAQALADVVDRAKRWLLAHPAEAQQIVAEELGFDLAVVRRAWPKFHWDAALSIEQRDDFQAKADFLAEEGLSRAGDRMDVARELMSFRLQQGPHR